MKPCVALLLIAQLWVVGADETIKSHFEGHKSSHELMRVLSTVDVSDRNMQTWWDQFAIAWAEYDLKVKQDPSLYCSKPLVLLSELKDLKAKIDLVRNHMQNPSYLPCKLISASGMGFLLWARKKQAK